MEASSDEYCNNHHCSTSKADVIDIDRMMTLLNSQWSPANNISFFLLHDRHSNMATSVICLNSDRDMRVDFARVVES